MKRFSIRLLLILAFPCITGSATGQNLGIPEGKFEFYWEGFIKDCRNASSALPFKIEAPDNCFIEMKYGNLFPHVAVPFILDGDTSLLGYVKIEYDDNIAQDDTTGRVIIKKRHRWFDFEAVGMFEYKDFYVVVYTYPLDDPNEYQCYTVNTYTKDGKRIDRLPFFKWYCNYDNDISWFEITGYIDEDFEITIQTRRCWEDAYTRHTGDTLEEIEKQQYKVYRINDEGRFELVNKEPEYVVDGKNNWTRRE